MSTQTVRPSAWRDPTTLGFLSLERLAALIGLVLVTSASMSVLYHITTEFGGTRRLIVQALFAIVAAWAVARYLRPWVAGAIFVLIVLVSYIWYFSVVIGDFWLLIEIPGLVLLHTIDDAIAIATGESVLTIIATDAWAHSFAPAPIFLTWYFGFRHRYVAASAFGGATMLIFVLSGDLGMWPTLIGTIGVVMTIGFGTIELTGASSRYSEALLVLITAMVVVTLLLPLVPSGGALGPLSFVEAFDHDDGHPSLESSVVGAGDELEIIGEVSSDPEVRFVVEREESVYLRTGIYDYYTGSGWERTGEQSDFETTTTLPDNTQAVYQGIRIETETDRMPAAGEPMTVFDYDLSPSDVGFQEIDGAIFASEELQPGDTYGIVSAVPQMPDDISSATVPDAIDERYLQLPDTVPDDLHDFTEDLLADAEGPVEKAMIVESFLSNSKGYTHNTTVPDGDLAAGFLFDMDAGYCTYFATTAVVMLRSADVPARMAVGYASGQSIDDTTSVLRGMNSHAWVEVYVEDHGWITFEPTPSGEWSEERQQILEDAREDDIPGVDIDGSEDLPFIPDEDNGEGRFGPGADPTDPIQNGNESPNGTDPWFDPGDPGTGNESNGDPFPDPGDYPPDGDPDDPEEDESGLLPDLGEEHLAVIGIGLVGTLLGIHRYNIPRRVRTQRRLRWHREVTDPVADLQRSTERLEWAMAKRFRPRRPGETMREYHRRYSITNDDERVEELFELIERARYGGSYDRSTAEKSRILANEIVDETVVFGGRRLPTTTQAR